MLSLLISLSAYGVITAVFVLILVSALRRAYEQIEFLQYQLDQRFDSADIQQDALNNIVKSEDNINEI